MALRAKLWYVSALGLAAWVAASCSASRTMHSGRGAPSRGSDEMVIPQGFFVWPASGDVSSRFGPRGNSSHDGIDIRAFEGSPVRAAADGVVVYSDRLRGYGNVVILQHRSGLSTVYAHNQANLARVGARVRRGDVIASVGQTGKTTGPNLHFEVRRNNVARDPLRYLPGRPPSIMAQKPLRIGG